MPALAQPSVSFELRAGLNAGGPVPIPFSKEIREISSINPGFNPGFEADVMFDAGSLQFMGGLGISRHSMTNVARVKSFKTAITSDLGDEISGYWTGMVETDWSAVSLTVPLMLSWTFSDSWSVVAGPYVSFLIDKNFSGNVYDGYMRHQNPTGEKSVFTDGVSASFDFGNEMRPVQMGFAAGIRYDISSRIDIGAMLDCSLHGIFKSDFTTISSAMYPVSFNLSVGYGINP